MNNKPITDWKDFKILDDILIPQWSKFAKRGDISLNDIKDKYGVSAEKYIEAVLLNEREQIIKFVNEDVIGEDIQAAHTANETLHRHRNTLRAEQRKKLAELKSEIAGGSVKVVTV